MADTLKSVNWTCLHQPVTTVWSVSTDESGSGPLNWFCFAPAGFGGRPLRRHPVLHGGTVRPPVLVQGPDSQRDLQPGDMQQPPGRWHHVVVGGTGGAPRRPHRVPLRALPLRQEVQDFGGATGPNSQLGVGIWWSRWRRTVEQLSYYSFRVFCVGIVCLHRRHPHSLLIGQKDFKDSKRASALGFTRMCSWGWRCSAKCTDYLRILSRTGSNTVTWRRRDLQAGGLLFETLIKWNKL